MQNFKQGDDILLKVLVVEDGAAINLTNTESVRVTLSVQGEDIDPVKICEEIREGKSSQKWIVDGGNRFETWNNFYNNVFALGKNLENYIVPYESTKKDENGNVVEKGKKIIVRMPQKGVFEAIKDVEANGTGEDADTSTIYNLVAAVLNNNMGNVKVSAEEVESYDIEECTAILNAYMEFVDELKANPN